MSTDDEAPEPQPEDSVPAIDGNNDSSAAIEDLVSAIHSPESDAAAALQQIARDGNLPLASERFLEETARVSGTGQDSLRKLRTISRGYEQIGRHGAGEVDGFVDLLHAESAPVRLCAANVLGAIGLPAESALPDLLETLQDDYPLVVSAAARALWKIDRRSDGLQALVTLLLIPDSTVRSDVLESLKLLGPSGIPSAPMVCSIAVVNNDEDIYRQLADAAEQVLFAMGPEVVPFIVAELERKPPGDVTSLIGPLGAFGSAAEPAVPALKDLMRGADEVVALNAASEVVGIDPSDQEALQVLRDRLADTRFPASPLRSLAGMGPHAEPAEEDILAYLEDNNAETRIAAAEALIRISRDPRAVATLLKELNKTGVDGYGAYKAAAALRGFGRFAIDDFSALVEPLRIHAAQLEQNDPFSGTILSLLLEILADAGPGAEAAVPVIHDIFAKTSDDELRLTAGLALWEITGDADEAIEVIDAALQSEVESSLLRGLTTAAELRREAAPLAPAFTRHLSDPRDDVRLAAADALLQLDPDNAAALDCLLAALNEQDRDLQVAAMEVLIPVGRHAIAAKLRAVELMQDGDRDVSRLAALLTASVGDVSADALSAIQQIQEPDNRLLRLSVLRRHTATVALSLTATDLSEEAQRRVLEKLTNGHDRDRVEVLRLLVRVPSDRVSWAAEAVQPLTVESDDELRNLAFEFLETQLRSEDQ